MFSSDDEAEKKHKKEKFKHRREQALKSDPNPSMVPKKADTQTTLKPVNISASQNVYRSYEVESHPQKQPEKPKPQQVEEVKKKPEQPVVKPQPPILNQPSVNNWRHSLDLLAKPPPTGKQMPLAFQRVKAYQSG